MPREEDIVRLPDNAIGPTDIRAYRDCPRRFEFGMRRHTEAGEHPEAQGPATAYGSAVHEAIAFAEAHDATDEQAIQHAFDRYAKWLDPEDLALMREDLAVYREREPLGVRTVAIEREVRIPLFDFEGETIWFRTRIDRLYQRLDNPAVFVHVDYKSSKHRRTEQEVQEDIQLWASNFAIHEEWPECEHLAQVYDQLRFGAEPTFKTADQRALVRQWLINQATAILRDAELAPRKNQWCPWCPLMESCPVVQDSTDFALARIAALAPAEKQGRRTVLALDPDRFGEYTAQLDDVGQAMRVLRRFDDSVKRVIREMPSARRQDLGYRLRERMEDVWPPEALQAVHGVLGDDFYRTIKLTKTALDERLKGDERVETVLAMADRRPGASVVERIRT